MNTSELVGVWHLVSNIAKSASGQERYPHGENPVGQIIYSSTGHMAVTMMQSGRHRFASSDLRAGTAEEIKEAFYGFDAYAGTYEVTPGGNIVVHHVQISRYPNWEGTDQLRHVKLVGDQLVLSTPPILAFGEEWVLTLSWRKAA